MGALICDMAVQVKADELEGCRSYFDWMIDKLDSVPDDFNAESMHSSISRELCRVLFAIDFRWLRDGGDIEKADETRAKDALEIRKIYAEEEGSAAGKTDREIDRIWKSVHGKTSVLELIFSLCKYLDAMVNEEEEGSMIGVFFRILIHNLGLDDYSDWDFGEDSVDFAGKISGIGQVSGEETGKKSSETEIKMAERSHRSAEIREIWAGRVRQWMDREYFESGCCGGIFPLERWKSGDKDQRKTSLWYQLNIWLGEHLDEDGRFCMNL